MQKPICVEKNRNIVINAIIEKLQYAKEKSFSKQIQFLANKTFRKTRANISQLRSGLIAAFGKNEKFFNRRFLRLSICELFRRDTFFYLRTKSLRTFPLRRHP